MINGYRIVFKKAYLFVFTNNDTPFVMIMNSYDYLSHNTVKPRPEVHMDMILFEVFLKNIHLIPQDQIVQWHYL